MAGLAKTFGISHNSVDGNDVEATALAAADAVGHARRTGPFVLECLTTRVRGHFEGDPQKYRSDDEKKELEARDPITISATRLIKAGVGQEALDACRRKAESAVAAAVVAARQDGPPNFEAALDGVYTHVFTEPSL